MIILVDMDETLVSMMPKWIYYHNKKFGTNYTLNDIDMWDLPGDWRTWETFLHEPAFLRDLPLIDSDAPEIIRSLEEKGHEVHIVSSAAAGESCKDKYMWFHTNIVIQNILPDMSRFHITRRKDMFKGDLLIDDGPHNIKAFPGHTIVFDRPWNQGLHYPRVKRWVEIPYEIEQIENARILNPLPRYLGGCY